MSKEVGKRMLEVINERKVGEYLFQVFKDSGINLEALKVHWSGKVEDGILTDITIDNNEPANVKITIIDVADVMKEINDNIKSLSENYREGVNLSDIVPVELLDNTSRGKYTEKFYSLVLNYFNTNRINGYRYSVSKDGVITRALGYKYKMKFISKNGSPFVQVTLANGSISEDMREWGVVVNDEYVEFPFAVFDETIDFSEISSEDIIVDKDSIEYFYGYAPDYEMEYSTSLNEDFVEEWWNCDCPNLIKFYPNVKDGSNWIGLNMLIFENTLVNCSWSGVDVDEDITEEEYDMITRNHKDSWISNDIKVIMDGKRLSEDEKKVLADEILEFEKFIGEKINENMEQILMETCVDFIGSEDIVNKEINDIREEDCMEDKVLILKRLLYKREPQILDCGFLYFHLAETPDNEKMVNSYKCCKGMLKGVRPWDSIDVPSIWGGQSTTIKGIIGKIVCKMMKERYKINLTYNTVLD